MKRLAEAGDVVPRFLASGCSLKAPTVWDPSASSKLDRLTTVKDRTDAGWLEVRSADADAERAYLSSRLV